MLDSAQEGLDCRFGTLVIIQAGTLLALPNGRIAGGTGLPCEANTAMLLP